MTTGNATKGSPTSDFYWHREWTGKDDPAHKAWNPYSVSISGKSQSKPSGYRTSTGAATTPYYVYVVPSNRPAAITTNLELKLVSAMADHIRDHSFNAAVFLAEMGQTLGLIGATLDGLHGIVQGTRARNIAMVTRAFSKMTTGTKLSTVAKSKVKAQDVSGALLATRYGWLPLLSDINEAMNAYATRMNGPRSLRYVRRVAGPREFATIPNPGIYGVSNPANKVFWRGQRMVRLEVEFLERLSIARSLGLYNPMSVLWEKMPWSFVFDWFIPIGRYFDTLGVIPFVDLKYMRSEYMRCTYNSWSGHPWLEKGYTFVGGHLNGFVVTVNRTIGTKLNVPPPGLKTISEAFSLVHLQNAAALIHQKVARR